MNNIIKLILLWAVSIVTANTFAANVQPGSGMSEAININSLFSGGVFTDTKSNATTQGFGNNYTASDSHGQASDDIWYKFTLSGTTQLSISLCNSGGMDTYLHLLNGSGTEVDYNDDGGPLCPDSYMSSLQTSLVAGTYYVVVEGYSTSIGNITTQISILQGYTNLEPPINTLSNWRPSIAISTATALKSSENNASSVKIVNSYIDGSGHKIQSVSKTASFAGFDIIEPFEYDSLDRQSKEYLPYVKANSTSGAYRYQAINNEQSEFYSSANDLIARTSTPYSKIAIEASPLRRIVERGEPGESGQLTGSGVNNSGHTFKYEYSANNVVSITDLQNTRLAVLYNVAVDTTGELKLVHGLGTSGQLYNANELTVKVNKGANWTATEGRAGTSEIFQDKDGRTVLKRVFNKTTSGIIEILSTYYVYDDFGNLVFVLPPMADPDNVTAQPSALDTYISVPVSGTYTNGSYYHNNTIVLSPGTTIVPSSGQVVRFYIGSGSSDGNVISADVLDKYCYQFKYDAKKRLVAGKKPGAGWKYIIYNSLDQIVATQSGNNRLNNEWVVNKYDGQGRLIIQGLWTNEGSAISRTDLQVLVNQQNKLWEERVPVANGYTALAFPQNINKYFTVNFYDDYNIPGLPVGYGYQNYSGNPDGKSNQTSGQLTATKTWSISNSQMELWSVHYYNSDGEIIQSHIGNHLSGKDVLNNEYLFTRLLKKSVRQHANATQNLTITTRYEYDHYGREVKLYSQIGSDAEILLRQTDYNELGQIIDKKLHQKSGSTKFLQSVDFRYNIKGWLKSVNDPMLVSNSAANVDDPLTSDADKFGLLLKYDDALLPQYNKNVGSIEWRTAAPNGISAQPTTFKYDYRYDNLNRMTEAVSSVSAVKGKNFSEFISYDKGSNISRLGRWAKLATGETQIDSLTYSYNGNQLHRIDDNTNNNVYGFTESVNNASVKRDNEYTYDQNGNFTSDLNKGVSSITYNFLNLPSVIMFSNGAILSYDYDCTGNKLKRTLTTSNVTYITDYIAGIQYEQGALAFVTTAEGLARRNAGNGTFSYQYVLRDQVGSARVIIQPVYPSETIAEIVQIAGYYPYGLEILSNESSVLYSYSYGEKNGYLFNGKELQSASEYYDFGARFYDAKTGRWNAPDPASQFYSESPYVALAGNPIINVDPDGRILPALAIGIGAVIGGAINVAVHWDQINGSWSKGLMAFGVGAGAGAAAVITGGSSIAATTTLGAIQGAVVVGAYSGMVSSMIQGVGNGILFGDRYGMKNFVNAAVTGGLMGGMLKGLELWFTGSNSLATSSQGVASAYGDEVGSTTRLTEDQTIEAIKDQIEGSAQTQIKQISTKISAQKQMRHLLGTAKENGSYLNSLDDAQAVLDAVHSGKAQILTTTKAGHLMVKVNDVTGFNVNKLMNIVDQPTNIFIIKGTSSPSVVPTNPFWKN